MEGGAWVGYSPWGRKELDMTEQLHFTNRCRRYEEEVARIHRKTVQERYS